MDIFHTLAAARLIFIGGIVNLVTGLLVLFTCRCLPTWKLGSQLMRYRPYRRFYNYHCYLWGLFWLSVVVHAIFAIKFLGWPG
jgi:hypothetical protein